jgi:hypothetical protein
MFPIHCQSLEDPCESRNSGTAKRAHDAGQLRHRAREGFLARNSPVHSKSQGKMASFLQELTSFLHEKDDKIAQQICRSANSCCEYPSEDPWKIAPRILGKRKTTTSPGEQIARTLTHISPTTKLTIYSDVQYVCKHNCWILWLFMGAKRIEQKKHCKLDMG